MKKLLYLAGILVAALAVSCEKAPEVEDITASAFKFTLRVSEIGIDYAKINVKHDGPEDATWYGFVAEDKNSVEDLCMEKYAEFLSAGTVKGLKTSTNRTVTVDGLKPDTKYKFIVFAITENAKLYTNVEKKSVTFTTGANPYELTQTDEWTITRLPERVENMEIINISSKNESPLYVWDYVSKEWVDRFNEAYPDGYDIYENYDETTGNPIGEVIATCDAFQTYIIQQIAKIQYYVAYEGYAITDLSYAYDSSNVDNNTFKMPRISSGEYYFVAFGFKHDASHTQTYSVSDIIVIEEEASTPEYEAWFGNYTFSGKGFWLFEDDAELGMKYGDEKDITYNITIEQLDNNFMYLIKGWECGEGADVDIETEFFEFNKEEGDYLGFIGYYNGGKLEIRETSILNDGANVFGMCGYADNNGLMSPVMLEDRAMAEALPIAAGENSTELTGLGFNYDENTYIKYEMMGYILYDYNTYQPLAIANMPMQFPITIAKSEQGYKSQSNFSAKQEVIKKMKTSRPISVKADKKNMPVKRSRR